MRRIVTFNWMSADGFFSGPDGDLSWVVPDDEQRIRAAHDISQFDAAIFGRKTYELFSAFWPRALDDPQTAPDPHHPGERSREHRVIALALNAIDKLVFSTTLGVPAWTNTRVHRRFDPSAIAAMKGREGKDIIVWGSGSIVSQLAAHDLIDEYQFVICPVILGHGRMLMNDLPRPVAVERAEAQPYRSGDLMLRYERSGARGSARPR
jgi:dihydrofolate reductase